MIIPGCPNAEPAVRVLKSVAGELGVEIQISLIVVENPEEAQRVSFHGSPSVRIEGEDLESDVISLPFSFGCRVYRDRGMLSGSPSESLVRKRMQRFLTRSGRTGKPRGADWNAGRTLPEYVRMMRGKR